MTFLDCGVGMCACGSERRLYRPEGTVERAMCLPCVQVWEFRRNPVDPKPVARKEHPVTAVVRQRRARFNVQGLCIDCGREPQIPGIKRGVNCRGASRKAS